MSMVRRPTRYSINHFKDESFLAIDCTGSESIKRQKSEASDHYIGAHVLARQAASFLVDTFPSEHRQFRTSGSARRQVIPTCEDHTSTCSSTRTKQSQ